MELSKELIRSHIRSLEAQLRILEARIDSSWSKEPVRDGSFADLYGYLNGIADSTEAEIDSSLYHLPGASDDE